MPGFYSWEDLFDYAILNFESTLLTLIAELTLLVKNELYSNWYNRSWYNPNSLYERTYELLNAITWRRIGQRLEFEIFYDESEINPSGNSEDEGWTQHRSKYGGKGHEADEDFITGLTEVMEYGNPSSVYGWSKGNAPKPFTIVEMFIREYIKDYILKEMRKRGFTITDRPEFFIRK